MKKVIALAIVLSCGAILKAQSIDIFVMPGSDFSRPGLHPNSNLNIGVGHTFKSLDRVFIGNELTFGYTYENAGNPAWLHTKYGEHSEQIGVMHNFPIFRRLSGYTWLQEGITSYTGNRNVHNRNAFDASLGGAYHFNNKNAIWFQETYSKVNTVPWYTSSGIGYTYSF